MYVAVAPVTVEFEWMNVSMSMSYSLIFMCNVICEMFVLHERYEEGNGYVCKRRSKGWDVSK